MNAAMTREPAVSTSTVSVCVNDDEATLIRDAARASDMTVSSWGASRCVAALANAQARRAVKEVADRIEATFAPRGSRKGRISMVMRAADHAHLKEAAVELGTNAHAIAQAALLAAAEKELGALPVPERLILENTRKAEKAKAQMLLSMPADFFDEGEVQALSETLRLVIATTVQQVREAGKGPQIAAWARRQARMLSSLKTVTARVYVPEFDVKALAYVLDVPVNDLAAALAYRAFNALHPPEE